MNYYKYISKFMIYYLLYNIISYFKFIIIHNFIFLKTWKHRELNFRYFDKFKI